MRNLQDIYRHGNLAANRTSYVPRSQVVNQTGVDAGSGFHNFANQAIQTAAAVGDERARRADYQFGQEQDLANKQADQQYKLGRMQQRTQRRQINQQAALTEDQMAHEQAMAQQGYQQQAALAQAAQQAALRQQQLSGQTDLQRAQIAAEAGLGRQQLANQGAFARTQTQVTAGQEEAQNRLMASMAQSMMGHYTPESISAAMNPAMNPQSAQPFTTSFKEVLPDGTPKYVNRVEQMPGQPGGLAGVDWGSLQRTPSNQPSLNLSDTIQTITGLDRQINSIRSDIFLGDEKERQSRINMLESLKGQMMNRLMGSQQNQQAPRPGAAPQSSPRSAAQSSDDWRNYM